MKILVANPNTSAGVTNRLVASGRLVASPGTELIAMTAPLAGLTNKIRERVPVPLVDGIQAAVTLAEGLVRLNPRKPTAGTFRRPGPKDSIGLNQALADVIGHKD